jgi:TrmH family RNA methyltransferase
VDSIAGGGAVTTRTPRVARARRLLRRKHRDEDGRFLAEGPQAVREALAAGVVTELFYEPGRGPSVQALADQAEAAGLRTTAAGEQVLAALTETVTPQGIVAVCRQVHVDLAVALGRQPSLVVVLAGIADPGNAGTILRTADAAGATAVIFPDATVDPYNGKCVRASAGSIFHVDLVRGGEPRAVVAALREAGLRVLAADAHGTTDLDEFTAAGGLAARTGWLFGSEAHGLPEDLAAQADARVRVPMHGRAESLNLAAAAAVCLYSSARAQHASGAPR